MREDADATTRKAVIERARGKLRKTDRRTRRGSFYASTLSCNSGRSDNS